MLTMFARNLTPPNRSFFLLGPRGTGKSTWLDQHFPHAALRIDLLKESIYLEYLANPEALRARAAAVPGESWIVIDEVQRVPSLLNEVHSILFETKGALKFCLTGSSARKLRRADANLLAGRALTRQFFPLTLSELGADADISRILAYGALPAVYSDPSNAIDLLDAYVSTYLQSEIQQEAATRNLPAFTRFLKVAALMNGQTVNVAGLARDVGVKRPTVERYFQILIDSLIGFWLPGWQPKLKVREQLTPKFYFFDPGVVRAIRGELRDPIESAERGSLLELLVLHELRAASEYLDVGGELFYYRTGAGVEVDIIWSRARHAFSIEVKAATEWKSEYSKASQELLDSGKVRAAYGVYRGDRAFQHGGVQVFPFDKFAKRLFAGEFFP